VGNPSTQTNDRPASANHRIAAACAEVIHQFRKSNPPEQSGTCRPRELERRKSKPPEHLGTSSSAADDARTKTDESNPMEHSGTSFTPRQHAALRILVRGHGTLRAARYVGVERHTITRWKRNPAFAAELERMTRSLQVIATRVRPNSFIAQVRGLADHLPHSATRPVESKVL
jgi:hypothetical protein